MLQPLTEDVFLLCGCPVSGDTCRTTPVHSEVQEGTQVPVGLGSELAIKITAAAHERGFI